MNDHSTPQDEEAPPSKTRRKKEMLALQALGEKLAALNEQQRAQLPLGPTLADALAELRRLKQNEARRRQLQYIGRLMREADIEAIRAAMERFDRHSRLNRQLDRQAEQWRERLLNEPDALSEFINSHPTVDIQHLRALLRQAHKESPPGSAARKLFRALRETLAD